MQPGREVGISCGIGRSLACVVLMSVRVSHIRNCNVPQNPWSIVEIERFKADIALLLNELQGRGRGMLC